MSFIYCSNSSEAPQEALSFEIHGIRMSYMIMCNLQHTIRNIVKSKLFTNVTLPSNISPQKFWLHPIKHCKYFHKFTSQQILPQIASSGRSSNRYYCILDWKCRIMDAAKLFWTRLWHVLWHNKNKNKNKAIQLATDDRGPQNSYYMNFKSDNKTTHDHT